MTEKQVKKFIEDIGHKPRHDCKALAASITESAKIIGHDNEQDLIELLLLEKPINSLMTHSYGFHTANGREIIQLLQGKYYENGGQ